MPSDPVLRLSPSEIGRHYVQLIERGSRMDIWETDKLLLFITFVVPGFISLKAYELLTPRAPKKSADQLIDAVAYSSVNYALLFWPISLIERSNVQLTFPNLYTLFYVCVLLVAPIGWAFLVRWLRLSKRVQAALPHPTEKPWDYVFSKKVPYWVIVTLRDGKQIAGKYDSESFASNSPAAEQIYLEETWVLNADGGFERPRVNTAGIMITGPDITSLEFIHMKKGASKDA